MDINTCFATTEQYRVIALYSHILPIFIALFLSGYALFKTRASQLSVVFFLFCLSFSLWLVGDLFTWASNSYFLIQFFWSWLDYTSILFFIFGAAFFAILTREKLHLVEYLVFTALLIPAFLLTATGNSVSDFFHPACEVLENDYLTQYKLFSDAVTAIMITGGLIVYWRKFDKVQKIRSLVVYLAIMLFFGVFSSTEYIATVTNIYEINLYGLFVLPVFLIILVFAMTNLGLFQLRLLGTQILAYILILTVGSQFLFLQDAVESTLSIVTLFFTLILTILFLQNSNREVRARKEIEQLAVELKKTGDNLAKANDRLEELDKQKSEFISIASHQLRTPLTAIRGYISLALEGAYGKVKGTPIEDIMNKMYTIDLRLSQLVEDLLNVSKIEAGKVQYKWESVTLDPIVSELYDMFAVLAEKKGLKLHMIKPETQLPVMKLDINKIKEILSNLIDNAIKYTEKGSVTIRVEQDATVARVVIEDTGIGISKEDALRLFGKFIRTETTQKMDAGGSGLGLFVGKTFVEGHGGRVYATSDGVGKGSSFIVELPLINPNAS